MYKICRNLDNCLKQILKFFNIKKILKYLIKSYLVYWNSLIQMLEKYNKESKQKFFLNKVFLISLNKNYNNILKQI